MQILKSRAWLIPFAIGFLFIAFSYFNFIYVPALDPADPDQGWAWLTTDPDVITYIKFNFRILGLWNAGMGVFVAVLAADGYRKGSRLAWWAVWYLPLHFVFLSLLMPWLIWLFILLILPIIAAQLVTRPVSSPN